MASPSTRTARDPDPDPDVAPRNPWPALVALSLAFGLVQLDATIVTVALPSMREALGAGPSVELMQWVVDGYTVALAAGMLTAGALGDRVGHRRTCVLGLALFSAATLGCALAPSAGVLIGARVLQGVGAALLLPSSLALITLLFPEPGARSRALGVWGGLASCGLAAGPLLGGALTQAFGWRAVFWVLVPAAAVVGVLIRVAARESAAGDRRPDLAGAVLGTAELAAGTAAIIGAGSAGASTSTVLLAAGSVAAAVAFTVLQRRRPDPMIPPVLFTSRAFRWAVTVGFLFNAALYGSLLAVTLVLRSGFGLGPFAAGLAVAPLTLVVFAGSTTSGFLTARTGARGPMTLGFTLAAVGAAVTLVGGLAGSVATIVVGMAVLGCCSLAMPAMTAVALGAAPASVRGLGSGVLNTARQIGGAIGVAVLGSVLAATSVSGRGLVPALAVTVGVYLLALVAARRATAG